MGGQMDTTQLKPIIEAMIFVSENPLAENDISIALDMEGVDKAVVRNCIAEIEKDWNENHGIALVNVAGGWQFRTKEAHAEWIKKLNVPKPVKLSGPALETLAIVAYRQPIVRSEIERIRGVDSGAVLKTLLDRRLLRIVGRQSEPGQPLLYGTTKEFLEIFNLRALGELPTLKDIEDLLRERRTLTLDTGENPAEIADSGAEEISEAIQGPKSAADDLPDDKKAEEEAIAGLEESLKNLRRLERNIFPRPPRAPAETVMAGREVSSNVDEKAGAGDDADEGEEDASSADDSPFQ